MVQDISSKEYPIEVVSLDSSVAIVEVLPSSFSLTSVKALQEVTLVNNGTAAASNLTLATHEPLVKSNDNCSGTSLAPGATCTFKVSFNAEAAVSGTGWVDISYNGAETTQRLAIDYLGATPEHGLMIKGDKSIFTSTSKNSKNFRAFTLVNTGATTIDNLKFSFPGSSLFATSTATVASPCLADTSLTPGQICNIMVEFDSAAATKGEVNFTVDYAYVKDGSQQSANQVLPLAYETTQAQAALRISTSNITFSDQLPNDGQTSYTQSVELENIGDGPLTNLNIALTNAQVFKVNRNSCNSSLAAGDKCSVEIGFGPVASEVAANTYTDNLAISYQNGSSNLLDSIPVSGTVIHQAVPEEERAEIILEDQVDLSGWLGGDGSQSLPYVVQVGSQSPQLTVTLLNKGKGTAYNFNVNPEPISSGWQLATNGNGCEGIDLEPGGTCQITYQLTSDAMASVQVYPLSFGYGNFIIEWKNSAGQRNSKVIPKEFDAEVISAPQIEVTTYVPDGDLSNLPAGSSFDIYFTLQGGYNVPQQRIMANADDANITFTPASCDVSGQINSDGTINNSCQMTVSVGENTNPGAHAINFTVTSEQQALVELANGEIRLNVAQAEPVTTKIMFTSGAIRAAFASGEPEAVTAGNKICQKAAASKGYNGNFKVYLAKEQLPFQVGVTYVRPDDGETIFTMPLTGILPDKLDNPVSKSIGENLVWIGDPDKSLNCVDWTSTLNGLGLVGDALATDDKWNNSKVQTCNLSARLYCIEQ